VGREPMRVEVYKEYVAVGEPGLWGMQYFLVEGSYAAALIEVGRLHIEWLDYVAAMPDDSGESFAGLGKIDMKREEAIAKVRSHPSHAAPKEAQDG
jgi:hypothetical protein